MGVNSFDPDGPADPGSGVFGLCTPAEEAALVLLAAPWEATVSYRGGTARGPEAILAASHQVELFDLEVGTPYEHGIAWVRPKPELASFHREALSARKRGDTEAVNRLCHQMVEIISEAVDEWMGQGRIVGLVGGDHSTALGAMEAAARRNPGLGVLQIDAHADLREAYQGYTNSHASVMYNVLKRAEGVARLVQVGVRDLGEQEYDRIHSDPRIVCSFDRDLHRLSWEEVLAPLPNSVWVSCDVDGLEPSLCPNTGTPVPGGLRWDQVSSLLNALVASGRRIVGFDLCEVSPAPGLEQERLGESWDAAVGARLLYRLAGWTLRSQPN